MSEIAEYYVARREESRARRMANKEKSTKLLVDSGVFFEIKNNGTHLIVHGRCSLIDFWPSTGKFITRSGNAGRGVKNLLMLCDKT